MNPQSSPKDKHTLKSLLYVNVIKMNNGWGAENFVNRYLKEIGIDTTCIDFREQKLNLANSFRQSHECDAIFLQRGDTVPPYFIKALNRPTVYWASELISRRPDQYPLIRSGVFSHIFFRTPQCINTVVEEGWIEREKCSILLSAYCPDLFKPKPNINRDIDILFVGSLTERRKEFLERLSSCGLNVTVKRAFCDELNDLMQRSKIILNIHGEDALDTETRVYEVLGAGGLLLTETLSDENPFTNGVHYVESTSAEEMARIAKELLANPAKMDRIRREGQHLAKEQHTYLCRARQIASVLQDAVLAQTTSLTPKPEYFTDSLRLKVRRKIEDALQLFVNKILPKI